MIAASPPAWVKASSCQRKTQASTGSSRVACQTSAARTLPVKRAVRATAAAHGGASGAEATELALGLPVDITFESWWPDDWYPTLLIIVYVLGRRIRDAARQAR